MKKLESARDHLLASPLDIRSDRLLTFAEEGSVTCHPGGPASLLISYTAHLIVTDYTGRPADLLFVVQSWVTANVPGAASDALKFHVDIIDHRKADVSLKLTLTDVIKATTSAAGTTLEGQTDADAHGFDMADLAPGLPES